MLFIFRIVGQSVFNGGVLKRGGREAGGALVRGASSCVDRKIPQTQTHTNVGDGGEGETRQNKQCDVSRFTHLVSSRTSSHAVLICTFLEVWHVDTRER